jgi:hypothetical protein
MNRRMLACRVGLTLIILLMFASTGLAQSKGVVVVDRAIIWRSDSSIALAVVNVGTVLELTGQSDRWYEVVVPEQLGGRGARGLIAKGQVKLVEGSDPPPTRALRGTPPTPPVQPRPSLPQSAGSPVSLRGFGQVGVMAFTARESFEAIFGQAYGPTFGGGVQLQFRSGPYVQGSVERFRKTGQRVFVFEGTTFPLGIPQTVTIQPISVTAGYRFPLRRVVLPYIGGGIGTHLLKEASPYDEPTERVDERHTSYHAHGGVEFRTPLRWVAPAVEARFTTVPDALGREGASAAFEEDDLGGWQLQMKVLVGR